MNLTEHILYNLNYEELDHYICRTESFKKAMIDYDEGFAKIVKRVLPNLSESEAIRLREEFMDVFSIYLDAHENETFKFAFANGLLIGFLSKEVSVETADYLLKMLGKEI